MEVLFVLIIFGEKIVEFCRIVSNGAWQGHPDDTENGAPPVHFRPPPAAACEPALSDFTAAADYAVCVPFHLAGRAAGKRGSAALYGSLRRHRAAVSPPQHPGAAVSDGAAHAGGTGRTALLPEVSRRPAHLPDRHPGTVYPALSPAPGHPESVPGKQPPGDRRRHLFAVSDLPFRHFGLPVLLNSTLQHIL